MASSPNIPEAPTPAPKPERMTDVSPEDIQLGGSEQTGQGQEGRRRLRRPRSSEGTGLQV